MTRLVVTILGQGKVDCRGSLVHALVTTDQDDTLTT